MPSKQVLRPAAVHLWLVPSRNGSSGTGMAPLWNRTDADTEIPSPPGTL